MIHTVAAAAGAGINLAGGWSKFWTAVSAAIGTQILTLLTIIGVLMVVGAIIKWIFDKRRGGGAMQGSGAVLWTLVAGSILAAPAIIVPLLLKILDAVINTLVALFNATG